MSMKWLWMLGLLATTATAQTKLDSLIPSATPFVTDAAKLFTPTEIASMNDVARRTQSTIGGDIAVLTLTDIYDYLPTEVALTAGRKWKVGGQGPVGSGQRNLGVVILIVPRTADHGGKCFIGTGQGAEGFITDSKAGALCRDNRTLFQFGKYGEATLNLVTSVSALMQEHVTPSTTTSTESTEVNVAVIYWIAIFGIFVVVAFGLFMIRQNRLDEEEHRRNLELWKEREAVEAKRRKEREALEAKRRAEAEQKERERWNALTPEQQAAEIEFRKEQEWKAKKQREIDEEAARVRRIKQEKQRRDEEDDRRRHSTYDSWSSSSSSSSDSSSSSSDSFGGGGGFSGGGGGSDF